VRFLSDEWLTEASGLVGNGTGAPVCVVEQVVRCDDHDVRYQVHVDDCGASIVLHSETSADVVIVEDYATAAALNRGELEASEALATGRITVSGDARPLAAAVDVLAALGDLLAPLRERTEY
jgi:predicted hotdog family 3-hydroxylacyl-ACP dehydratase